MEEASKDQPNFSLGFDFLAQGRQANKSNEAQQARFPNLSEHDLQNILVERHSTGIKKATNWSVATFIGNHFCCFRRCFLVTFAQPAENKLITKSTKQYIGDAKIVGGNFTSKNITATLKHG